ncbi:hypothetical protein [Gloeothece verrucosa]|uniref:Uncharacterized protein n=1 Tax=Gloeothece verrucosa (strain PCC 7822) TaxID=497965 RepID=E0UAP5_GLOV7|nr:hypothetical protein [Gloeothece verrucosa]ADN13897.1 conserved hypothetical protein [Gloeothece verrucosa PCC 7822]
MKKVVLMVFLAGLLGGCGLFGKKTDETATTQPSPVPNASPSPAATPPQPFDKDKAQVNGSNGDIDIAGLIPSRPPNQVPIKNGRTDPFAVVPVRPTIKIDPTKGPLKPPIVPVEPRSNNTNSLGPTKNTNTANNPPNSNKSKSSSSSTGRTKSGKQVPASSKSQSPVAQKQPVIPPAPPEPKEAESIYVSGVVGLPSRPIAIVKVPGENVERTVTSGSFLANGQVLVKAIYAYSDNPVVILEQYGIQVTKKVGEAPVEAQAPDTPAPDTPAPDTPANPQKS